MKVTLTPVFQPIRLTIVAETYEEVAALRAIGYIEASNARVVLDTCPSDLRVTPEAVKDLSDCIYSVLP